MGRSQIPREIRRLAERLQASSGNRADAEGVVVDQITSDRLGKEQATSCSTGYRLKIALKGVGPESCRRWALESPSLPAGTVPALCVAVRTDGAGIIWKEGARGSVPNAGPATALHW